MSVTEEAVWIHVLGHGMLLPFLNYWGRGAIPLQLLHCWGHGVISLPFLHRWGHGAIHLQFLHCWGHGAIPLPFPHCWGNGAIPLAFPHCWGHGAIRQPFHLLNLSVLQRSGGVETVKSGVQGRDVLCPCGAPVMQPSLQHWPVVQSYTAVYLTDLTVIKQTPSLIINNLIIQVVHLTNPTLPLQKVNRL